MFLLHNIAGQLFLENEEFRETLDRHLKTIELQEQMLSSKDTMIQVLGQFSNENKKEVDNLQSQKRNLESIITNVQHQKADLQLEFNSLKRKHDQHLAELEDERTDKQQLQADKQALIHTITAHEHNIDRLTDTVKDLGQRLQRESKDKSAILKELSKKLKLVAELKEDREIFMMENEAQGKYFSELKEEKIKLKNENKELKEAIEISKMILAVQNDKLMIKVAELESENSNLHSRTEEQSATISDLESKNSDLERKTEQQSTTITAIQQQNQRQQYFILFLAALIFAMVCLQLLSQGNNLPSTS